MNLSPPVLQAMCTSMSLKDLEGFLNSSVQTHNACVQIYNQKLAVYRVQKFKYDLKQKILANLRSLTGKNILDLSNLADDGSGIELIPISEVQTIFNAKQLKFVPGYNAKIVVIPARYNEIVDVLQTNDPDQ